MTRLTAIAAALLLAAWACPATAQEDALQAHLKKLKAGDDKAADALVALGGRAAPALVKFLQESNNYSDGGPAWAAATALGRIGSPAVPALRDYLKQGKGNPAWGLSALHKMGSAASPALPEVMAVVAKGPTGDPNTASAYPLAVDVIGRLGADAREAVPVLIKQLTPKNPYAAHLIVALGRMGAAARDAVPALTEVEKEGPAVLRVHAKDSLRRIKG